MAQVTLAEITKLRQATGAGMMDCKKALEDANGDMDKAIENIRKKGQLVASKRADRDATEGNVLALTTADGKFGTVIALNCETDFVAKNADFVKLAELISKASVENKPSDLDGLKNTKVDGKSLIELVVERVGVTGEKMDISYYGAVKAEKVISYIHPGSQLACIVGFNKAGFDEQVYKDIAMQVAAMSPVAVDKDFVTAEKIASEMEIGREQARLDGKPENMIEKIAEGKLNKFFKEATLLNQEFIKDNKKTIKQHLQSIDKDLTVTDFRRYALKD
jgi:elongation factor Ts